LPLENPFPGGFSLSVGCETSHFLFSSDIHFDVEFLSRFNPG
jgi:hypothetical protein